MTVMECIYLVWNGIESKQLLSPGQLSHNLHLRHICVCQSCSNPLMHPLHQIHKGQRPCKQNQSCLSQGQMTQY